MLSSPDYLTDTEMSNSESFSELQALQQPEGELYLRFFVSSGYEFALPATGIREVLSIAPDLITSVPNTSPILMGVFNLRGQVVWIADVGQFLGEAQPINTDRAEISVVAVESQDILVGLAVDQVTGMDWLSPDQLSLSTQAPDQVAPFLKGEWEMAEAAYQRLWLLDPVAILRSARWAT
ncbi:chemotaxis protein CheW [Synechococcales cyanobacterium C]|uniref:Chemotaxis protein CheW n=1 Tax=Petrachloros mirabilis ULC683 TaxID=2781853 RepID=A0A8K2A9G4_9CYAN|nr:chemotaxis protein CheW [Petrachloros mirabilis]NCJ08244.1 chemotaxis protein CheW [Petrachloros mirabilis ULC683]